MKKLYSLTLLLLIIWNLNAQDCSSLQLTYTVHESRCVATGSIDINATGGSHNYNYRAIGTINTPYTSSNSITGLPPGYYSILVKDLYGNCTKQVDSVYVPGSYADPRFQLIKSDASCVGNDGTISTSNQQYGRSPFTYTIIAPSASSIGTSTTTGNFTGLIPGEYSVQLQDSCGGLQVRKITIENYSWWFDNYSVTKTDCNNASVFIGLKDNKGNTNLSGTAFDGYNYGVIMNPGDTIWNTSNNFSISIGTHRNLELLVKDKCGNIQTRTWSLPAALRPSIAGISITDQTCTSFTATVNGQQNLTTPNYCLYDSVNNLVACNATGVFTGLSYGSYCIKTTDACYDTTINNCFRATTPQPGVDDNVSINHQDCSLFTAGITGQQNLPDPNYCLYDVDNNLLSCNNTGTFPNLSYGSYCIRITNSCTDTIISRCFTAIHPIAELTAYHIAANTCSSFDVSVSGNNLLQPLYCLYDSTGTIITCDSTGVFQGLPHGHYCIRAISCADTTAPLCFSSNKPIPSVASWVQVWGRNCNGFSAAIAEQTNLTAPQFCLYNDKDSLLQCNTTGEFDNLAWGSYCIRVKDSCTDSTITRCFTETRPDPMINSWVQQTNASCSNFTATVSGNNFTNPEYCVFDSLGNKLSCNTTGVFDGLPYGQYCFSVKDGCVDTTMQVCQTFTLSRGFSVQSSKSCNVGNTQVSIQFENNNGPYKVKIIHPDGSVKCDTVTYTNPYSILLPGLPAGKQYTIIGTDGCGQKDTSLLTPNASNITKSIVVRAKCPSATWVNGAGDLQVTCTSNYYTTQPGIIKKNGVTNFRSFSSRTGDVYTFSDLEPATYIVEYTMQTCNYRLYDTVTIQPYAYPSQGQSAIYQCDNNTLSLGSDIKGGVSPYTYQIIGSTPSTPDITTAVQTSPIFSINTGTVYSLVRLRAVDGCGNATLNDVSVLPLQNISVKASQKCFYKNTTLSIDTVPNATYEWYRKYTSTDSVLVGTGLTYNLPFFDPSEAGQYVCKMSVNNGCLLRFSSYLLDGDCGYALLPLSVQLQGKHKDGINILTWNINEEKNISSYTIERKAFNNANFSAIGELKTSKGSGSNHYVFKDQQPAQGNQYRIKLLLKDGHIEYSSIISISGNTGISIFPNPVKDQLNILFSGAEREDFTIELFELSGRLLFKTQLKSVSNNRFTYQRDAGVQKGMYLLNITNTVTGVQQTFKVIMN
jgi:hypothetical protein